MLEHFHFGGLIPGPARPGASTIKPNDLASLGTCVLIFSKVILKHRFAFQALINAGILDVLLAIQDRQYSIDSLKNIYDIVLTSLYMDSVSDKALKIISYQITHESSCLLRALRKYSEQEFQIVAPAILQGLRYALSRV
ncbi:hypothetical protein GALMADRAFT_712056 [Galerina marginata CBS 339.88]|uniref:Uncharacterized protein n=1 Tax=Galerina marginata (strain CBS 339.88) TaxID=685588 RepID=A0A067TMH5_GALM3|nr:hypothetical protein GALMADRAFT_712056 [Galerina marginata CBS 339.88]